MRNIWTICRRELRSYFFSPIAYVFGLLFLGITCWYGSQLLRHEGQASMVEFFRLLPQVFIGFLPALTMRLWAEERKTGTLELLLTFPVSIPQIIAGKFFAAMVYLALLLILTLALPVTMAWHGKLDWYSVSVTYFASLLLAAAYVSVGMFWSSITRDQIIAFLLALVTLFALFKTGEFGQSLIGLLPEWLGGDRIALFVLALSPQRYFDSIARGVVDTGDLVFYLCFCAFFLHANALVLYGKRVKG
ncbi:MAG: ABC transporter permease subunit [Planctomycetes bacterium]|nr:ABC transporter permease subunit [Planctomycetota bacterium]MCB9868324.1 ABC transporter permease subunit [Planctomycetota bacterium]